MSDDAAAATARAYRRFADEEVRGCSPLYEDLARQVAGDREILDFLLTLPREKRQPNLLLAALRSLAGTPSGWPEFRRAVLSEGDRLREVMLARSTQTNEPGRCATLLPVLARLPPPLALIEIGASAGLCLIPDRYGYDYGGRIVEPSVRRSDAPVFPCDANAATPIPAACPEIVWRAGLDLEPIDVRDPAETAWLEALVWPEQTERLGRLRQSLAIAAGDPPRVIRGDLRRDLPALAREAPKDATMVIFHTAVLLYVGSAVERADFARLATELCDFWIATMSRRASCRRRRSRRNDRPRLGATWCQSAAQQWLGAIHTALRLSGSPIRRELRRGCEEGEMAVSPVLQNRPSGSRHKMGSPI